MNKVGVMYPVPIAGYLSWNQRCNLSNSVLNVSVVRFRNAGSNEMCRIHAYMYVLRIKDNLRDWMYCSSWRLPKVQSSTRGSTMNHGWPFSFLPVTNYDGPDIAVDPPGHCKKHLDPRPICKMSKRTLNLHTFFCSPVSNWVKDQGVKV